MAQSIQLRELGDGDFEVVRGGDVYRRWQGQTVPGRVQRGERVSAAEVCEWQDLGVEVRPSRSSDRRCSGSGAGVMDKEQVGRFGSADRAAGLRPQPPAASSQSSIPSAEGRGYIAGMLGHPSLPGTYVEVERQAYERAYDIGRRIRSEAVEELVEALSRYVSCCG